MRVTWTASERETRPKRPLTLTARVTNAGPSAAPGTAVLLYPPSGLVISRSPRDCSEESGLWRCELGVLAAGQTILLEIAGSVATFASRELIATAEVRSSTPDPNLANNSASITVPLETQVDLSVSAYLLPRFPAPGQTATLTISATNRGPAWADNVVLTAELAAEVELLHTPSGCSLSGRQLRCAAGTLPTGRTRAYLLQVRLRSGSGFQGGGGSGFLADVTGASTTPEYAPANNNVHLVQ